MKALVYGELIWDRYEKEAVIGGAPFNFAAHLSLLGNEVALISGIGNDELGDKALEKAKAFGIKTDLICVNDYPTGVCNITLDNNGIPHYEVVCDTAYDNITADIEKVKSISADMFYFNTLIQRATVSRNTLRGIISQCRFKEVFCDINLREGCFDRESLEYCLKNCTIVKISDEEGHFLYDLGLITDTGDFMRDVADAFSNIKMVVYTLGAEGSQVLDVLNDKKYNSGKPEQVSVVSTVGAGDCYGATFISEYFNHADINKAIKKAAYRSGVVVAHKDAVPF